MQVKLLSRVVETYHGAKPVSKSGSTIKYGPYTDVAPFSGGALTAHFENNSPFLDALSLMREIEVSHWGNVYVEEWYTVKHMGAQHKVRQTANPDRECMPCQLRSDQGVVQHRLVQPCMTGTLMTWQSSMCQRMHCTGILRILCASILLCSSDWACRKSICIGSCET